MADVTTTRALDALYKIKALADAAQFLNIKDEDERDLACGLIEIISKTAEMGAVEK